MRHVEPDVAHAPGQEQHDLLGGLDHIHGAGIEMEGRHAGLPASGLARLAVAAARARARSAWRSASRTQGIRFFARGIVEVRHPVGRRASASPAPPRCWRRDGRDRRSPARVRVAGLVKSLNGMRDRVVGRLRRQRTRAQATPGAERSSPGGAPVAGVRAPARGGSGASAQSTQHERADEQASGRRRGGLFCHRHFHFTSNHARCAPRHIGISDRARPSPGKIAMRIVAGVILEPHVVARRHRRSAPANRSAYICGS